MKAQSVRYDLKFRFKAGTSRGVLTQKSSWFVEIEKEGKIGVGECGILKGLSIENFETFNQDIQHYLHLYKNEAATFPWNDLDRFPSLKFGLEMAEKDLSGRGKGILFDNAFTRGEKSIPINGLVWMGDYSFMFDQIKKKIDAGFSCIKIKIGAIDFEKEIALLKYIRSNFSQSDIEIRVDANGAFQFENALEKLKRLAEYNLHSIEQPIKQGQWASMAELCAHSPLPIALDEELIGITDYNKKAKLLDLVSPQYIILKPSLIGGFSSSEEWIMLANERKIGYWVTSALESNIGLNAIAQWTFEKDIKMPQGLGTGQLYENNFEGPLFINRGSLHFNPEIEVYQNFNLFKT